MKDAKKRILAAAAEAGVPVAHPHVSEANAEEALAEGYQILFTTPTRNFGALNKVHTLIEKKS